MEGDFSKQHGEKDIDNTDGNGSLTYSASSSINSHSTAGESTDSAFSGIMKGLDLNEDPDFDRLICKGEDGVLTLQQREQLLERHAQQQRERREMQSYNGHRNHRGEDSSLQYSTDYTDDTTTSPLDFTQIQTVPGQPSDSHAHDGGGFGTNEQGVLFAPANPTRPNKNRMKKHQERIEKNNSNSSMTSHNSRSSQRSHNSRGANTSSYSSNARSAGRSRSDPISGGRSRHAPPSAARLANVRSRSITGDPQKVLDAFANSSSPPPRGASRALDKERTQQLWYKQWWMCGFTDALNFDE